MRLLALESSAKAASVALCEDGRLVAQYYQAGALTHSRTLVLMAERILEDTETELSDVDAIAVPYGPGSFTGVRIGVAAAKGICWGADKPICGVSTLEAMAWQHGGGESEVVNAVMDARRGEIYNAKFVFRDGAPERLCPDRAVTIDELVREAREDGRVNVFIGDGAEICYERFKKEGLCAVLPAGPLRLQTAWGVAMAALRAEPMNADDLDPKYLRLSQAERERLAKNINSN